MYKRQVVPFLYQNLVDLLVGEFLLVPGAHAPGFRMLLRHYFTQPGVYLRRVLPPLPPRAVVTGFFRHLLLQRLFGIEGEKEFKNALRDINQSFKVLGSEMKLVSSEFDKQDTI